MNELIRLEIIANKALEERINEELRACQCNHYTIIPEAYGKGRQEPKQGDAIWPEINYIIIVYCDNDMAEKLKKGLGSIKKEYPFEGLRMFKSKAEFYSDYDTDVAES